ncbi:MAG: Swt1 family HEPN domain-containing protein [Chloroflexota bacterium]
MTEKAAVRNWLFKALAVEQAMHVLEADGVSVRAAEDSGAIQRVMPLEDFSVPIRRSAMQALPGYLAFFCLENAVRELVNERMTENHSAAWWSTLASADIRKRVGTRQSKEGKDRWHIKRGKHEIYYTDFGDLRLIILNNWADFEDLFPDQNWVISRLGELEASRNIIAHSNTLDERELARIKLYLKDWTKQVG